MTERPILFSGAMVRAILAGTKTQTRRQMYVARKATARSCFDKRYPPSYGNGEWPNIAPGMAWTMSNWQRCSPGDRLWVRETWQYAGFTEDGYPFVRYDADNTRRLHDRSPGEEWSERWVDIWAGLSEPSNFDIDGTASDHRWRPSIHMPRWASRITLEITGVRVERLQDISEADARAEGVEPIATHNRPGAIATCYGAYGLLWDEINGAGAWDANPWVWAIDFRKVDK